MTQRELIRVWREQAKSRHQELRPGLEPTTFYLGKYMFPIRLIKSTQPQYTYVTQ